MGLFDRVLGTRRAGYEAAAAEWARNTKRAGHEAGQTANEQAATRDRSKAELDGQRTLGASLHAPVINTARHRPPPMGRASSDLTASWKEMESNVVASKVVDDERQLSNSKLFASWASEDVASWQRAVGASVTHLSRGTGPVIGVT